MSDLTQQPQQRDFHCSYCNERIVIPFSLPSTTGPCPHCNETIISPPPPEPSPAPEEVLEAPQKPVHLPAASRTENPAPRQTTVPVQPEKPPVSVAKAEPTPGPPVKERKSSSGIMKGMLVLLLLILVGGAAFYFMTQNAATEVKPPSFTVAPKVTKAPASEYNKTGWKKEAPEVLEKFLAGKTAEEKLPYINDAERLGPKLIEFYGDAVIADSDTPTADFQLSDDLPDTDLNRGIFLMTYTQPLKAPLQNFNQQNSPPKDQDEKETPLSPEADDSDPTAPQVRIYAFFKHTPDGLKLDWEVFAQTKYGLLQNFIDRREIGSTQTFRILISEEVPEKGQETPGIRSYSLVDPTTMAEAVEVDVIAESEAGRALSTLQQEPSPSTATVELVWAEQAGKPKLEIKRLVSWEFLGLGGTEIPATTSEQ